MQINVGRDGCVNFGFDKKKEWQMDNIIKEIPSCHKTYIMSRKYIPDFSNWAVWQEALTPGVAKRIEAYWRTTMRSPLIWPDVVIPDKKLYQEKLRIGYVGSIKGSPAFASAVHLDAPKDWNVIFWGKTLEEWFNGTEINRSAAPTENYYQILGLSNFTKDEAEIRSAYRRMCMKYHPDVYKAPDATQRFQIVNEANATLSNPLSRGRYDVGLMMDLEEAYQAKVNKVGSLKNSEYKGVKVVKLPFHCGDIECSVFDRAGKKYVEEIFSWEDIKDGQGHVLVTSFDINTKSIIQNWI